MDAEDSWDTVAEFTLAEVIEMENAYKERVEESFTEEFCKRLATSFSRSPNRAGKSSVTWEQVQTWFLEKQKEEQTKLSSSSMALQLYVDPSGEKGSSSPLQPIENSTVGLFEEFNGLRFEAKSSRDDGWYDVGYFTTFRIRHNGDTEVRVRFLGYNNTHDEWVNLREGVRERSIPLEPSDCARVKIGSLVMCFQVKEDQSVYYDAHVLEIQRRVHDEKTCTCSFLVRYDHDNTMEMVQMEKLCVRPHQDHAKEFDNRLLLF